MKLYHIAFPGSPASLVIPEQDGVDPLTEVVLGEDGRGRVRVIIPVVGDGPEVRLKRTEQGFVFVRGGWNDNDGRCYAVIHTVGSYDRRRRYDLFDADGVQRIVSGTYAWGDAGGINGGPEVLAVVEPGATFRLNRKEDSVWYAYDGTTWSVEREEQRAARIAAEIVAQGGGEWL